MQTQPGPGTHAATLQLRYLELIRSGSKTVEGRTNSGWAAAVKAGDRVLFSANSDPSQFVLVEVTAVQVWEVYGPLMSLPHSDLVVGLTWPESLCERAVLLATFSAHAGRRPALG